jgi:hypothetical protein
MKKIIIPLLLSFFSVQLFAQQNPANEAMVYFQSGVTRNPDNTATITSQNVLNILNNLNIPSSNVIPAFPEFNESDTTISFPEFLNEPVTKEMNRTKVFRIICVDTFRRNQLITNLLPLNEVLFAEANGTVDHDFIPSDTRFNEQWGLRNTVSPEEIFMRSRHGIYLEEQQIILLQLLIGAQILIIQICRQKLSVAMLALMPTIMECM